MKFTFEAWTDSFYLATRVVENLIQRIETRVLSAFFLCVYCEEGQKSKNHLKIKKMKHLQIAFYVFCLSVLCSCNSYKYGAGDTSQKSNLTFGVVKSKIAKGHTTQNEILNLFGAPNLVTKNKANNEVWSYNKMSAVSKGGNSSFLDGSRASVSSSNQSFDLIITFDDNDVVKDYSVISSSY